jgi:hypothetical protein
MGDFEMKIHSFPNRRNDTLIIIQTHGGVDAALRRHWPWLQLAGSDMIVTSPHNDPSTFEGPLLGLKISDPPRDYFQLQSRTLSIFERVSELHTQYSSIMLLPYDCIFLKPIASQIRPGFETRVDLSKEAFISPLNSTPPWWFDWPTLETFLTAAKTHPLDFERGIMDRWFAAVCHLHDIPMLQTSLIGYGRNNVSDDWPVVEASIKDGFPLVHGIKTEAEFKRVLEIAKA